MPTMSGACEGAGIGLVGITERYALLTRHGAMGMGGWGAGGAGMGGRLRPWIWWQ